jgi:DNA-3-methyladenine glycosylase I
MSTRRAAPSAAPVRCAWCESTDEMREYHDREWGRPSHDDRYLFEFLVLEGAQAGLSWATVLRKRAHYREVLDQFDVAAIAGYGETKLAALLADPGIIRHRQKVASLPTNAAAFLAVQDRHGSFADYLWSFVDGRPEVHDIRPGQPLEPRTALSDRVSKDLLRGGFKFVGSTIVYSYLQAVGVVDDHTTDCFVRTTAGAHR